jgi:hypothetical protein
MRSLTVNKFFLTTLATDTCMNGREGEALVDVRVTSIMQRGRDCELRT